jgi:prolyl 4-hydroxylase
MNRLSYVAQNLILHVKDWKNEEVSKKLLFKDMKSARNFLDALLVTLEAELSSPSEQRFDTDKAEIYWIDDFLTDAECDALIPTIKSKTAQGGITNKANTDPGFRTAQVHDFEGIPWIQQKIADHMGIHTNFAEPLQGQVYEVGQLFKEHADYFDAVRPKEYDYYARQQGGQRTWTFMVYLSEVEAGGETDFPYMDIRIKPKKGMALVWNNLYMDGSNNTDTRHQSLPVIEGEKVIVTQWFRTHIWEYAKIPQPTEAEK